MEVVLSGWRRTRMVAWREGGREGGVRSGSRSNEEIRGGREGGRGKTYLDSSVRDRRDDEVHHVHLSEEGREGGREEGGREGGQGVLGGREGGREGRTYLDSIVRDGRSDEVHHVHFSEREKLERSLVEKG